jgi:hypothetical protein
MYLSSIQQGIQAAHAQTVMALKYTYAVNDKELEIKEIWHEWARNYQTMICLNGGMDVNLQEIKQLMTQPENPYPWSYFNESEEAMNSMLTNVAIVLPERIYNTAQNIRSRKCYFDGNKVTTIPVQDTMCFMIPQVIDEMTDWEIRLIELLNSCGLAK